MRFLELDTRFRQRSGEGFEAGFTLVELSVVVLILAILIAAAIPTFLGAREAAQDRAAQSELMTAFETAKVVASDDGSYPPYDANLATARAAFAAAEPALDYVPYWDVDTAGGNGVGVYSYTWPELNYNFVYFNKRSESGTLYCLYDYQIFGSVYTYYLHSDNPDWVTCDEMGW